MGVLRARPSKQELLSGGLEWLSLSFYSGGRKDRVGSVLVHLCGYNTTPETLTAWRLQSKARRLCLVRALLYCPVAEGGGGREWVREVRTNVCIHVCMCLCMCVHVCACSCMYICLFSCVHVSVCVFTCVHMCFHAGVRGHGGPGLSAVCSGRLDSGVVGPASVAGMWFWKH